MKPLLSRLIGIRWSSQRMTFHILCPLLLFVASFANAQTKDYSKDVASAEAIVTAVYDVISVEPGVTPDWDRFRNLFRPETRLIPTRKSANGELTTAALQPEEYVTLFAPRVPKGFHEKEIHRVVESYGTITHVFSTYETRDKKDGPVTNRGVNSIQLFNDGKRYYIVTIYWCAESMGFPLPEKYLTK